MLDKLKQYFAEYKEQVLYLFFGGMTTLVNIVTFWIFDTPVPLGTIPATIIAWIASVLFAYVTNRIWVFESKTTGLKGIAREAALFFGCRAFSGVMDVGIMWLFVDILHFNSLVIKVLSNILVIILNYLFSKILIFRTKPENANEIEKGR